MATREIGHLRTRLSFEDGGTMSSLQRFKQDLAGLRSEMRTVTSLGKDYKNSLAGLKQQQDILNRELKVHQERVKEINRRYQEAVKAKGEDSEEARKLTRQYNNAVAQMQRTEGQLKRVTQAIKDQQNPWKNLGKNLESASQKFKAFGDRASEFGRAYTMRVTAPIVAGGTAAFKAAMDFESAFAGVRKVLDASEAEFDELARGIREMAKEIPASAVEIAGVAEAAGQLGISKEHILEFTRTMIDLGETTNLSAEQAATEFARFANIVGMSQEDFDRLGSVVVELGNNLATTESEIISMAMRLAGAGTQIGLSEAQIMSFAAALSSVGIEAEAGGSAFSRVMINIANEVHTNGKNLQKFAKIAGMSSKEFVDAFKNDAAGAIMAFIRGLGKMSKEGENVFGVLEELGLSEIRVRDALLRASEASDVFTDSLEIGSKAWKENTALTKEAEQRYKTTESQIKIMWNRIKDVAIEIGTNLAPAVTSALDAAKPFIDKIGEGAKAFSELSKEQQQSILKTFGFIAAVGPASRGIGALTSGIGGLLKAGSSLSNLLGKADDVGGGVGLLAQIAKFGRGGVVGLAIGGIGALAYAIYNLRKEKKELNNVSLDTYNSLMDQYRTNEDLIKQYDELRGKSKLTNDEFARYVDLQAELEEATDPKVIEDIKKEMDELQKKSGLSNQELDEMIKLNDTIVERMPEATGKITEQGKKIAGTTSELEKYNKEVLKMATLELESQFFNQLENQAILLEDLTEAQKELRRLKEEEKLIDEYRLNYTEEELEALEQKLRGQLSELKAKMATNQISSEQTKEVQKQKEELEKTISLIEDGKIGLSEQLKTNKENQIEQQKIIKNKELELAKTDMIVSQLIEQYLLQAGISQETARNAIQQGTVLETIEEQIIALEREKKALYDNTPAAEQQTEEFRNGIEAIDEQIEGLKTAKSNIENLIGYAETYNDELGKEIEKKVKTTLEPSAKEINERLSVEVKKHVRIYTTPDAQYARIGDPVTKQVNITTAGGRFLNIDAYASGTDYAPGGLAMVGEEGPELIRYRNKWALAGFGLVNLPRGAQVFPHDETKRILNTMDRLTKIQGFANGARPSGEANRLVDALNNYGNRMNKERITVNIAPSPVYIDGKQVAEIIWKPVMEKIDHHHAIEAMFRPF